MWKISFIFIFFTLSFHPAAIHKVSHLAIQDAAAARLAADQALEARVKSNEDKLAVVQGAADVEGSIAKAEADAKAYADEKITALVDSAPDAMNTLGELAKAIKDHTDVYEAYVDGVADLIATAKGEAIADAAGKDAALEAKLNKKIADDIAAESALRVAEEARIENNCSLDELFREVFRCSQNF